jgi:hypothetical protein
MQTSISLGTYTFPCVFPVSFIQLNVFGCLSFIRTFKNGRGGRGEMVVCGGPARDEKNKEFLLQYKPTYLLSKLQVTREVQVKL